MNKISVYVIAYNEAEKLAATLHSVAWADEVLVIDSHSTDGTIAIAEGLGAKVVQVEFKGFGDLRNQAIAACTHPWIFSLDADERCTPEVQTEILALLQSEPAADTYFVPRRNFFMGRWIRHSGWYPNYRQPQLFRKGAMAYDNKQVHENFILLTNKAPAFLKNAIWQLPFKNISEVLHKANRYSSLGAERVAAQPVGMGKALVHGLWAFVKHYVFKRGFLDGWPGFVIALGNFEGTYYRYVKAIEIQQAANWKLPPQFDVAAKPSGPPASKRAAP